MSRKGWIYTPDGRVIEKGTPEHYEYLGCKSSSPAFIPDEGEFVSPIDKQVYSGRAGMRDHNRRHNVVNNRDLAGLPTLTTHQEYKPDRAAIRGEIIKAARQLGHI
jgi:hypothetical protein